MQSTGTLKHPLRIVVAVTGASGAIYARQTLERLIASHSVGHIALICSQTALKTVPFEGETLPSDPKITVLGNDDLFAAPASGSSRYDAMIVVPCSAGTLGRIAAGIGQTLIERSADVMLKERRRLILALRETPLSLIHLRNMTTVTEAGAIVVPASPSFYSHPKTTEELAATVVERILSLAGVDTPHFEWEGSSPSSFSRQSSGTLTDC